MNNIENVEVPLGFAYMILHPNKAVTRTPEGNILTLAHLDKGPNYLAPWHFEQMERDGLITIVRKGGGTGLAESYGRVQVEYRVN